MSIVKSISFTDEYLEEYQHFMSVPNRSKYVCELIRKDLTGGGSQITIEFIERLIDSKIKNLPLNTDDVVEDFTEEIRDNLSSIFGGLV